MPFIGVQPASALLTSADIQDGQITTAKVADDAITGAKIENNPTIAGTLNASAGLTTPSGHVIQVQRTYEEHAQAEYTTTSTSLVASGLQCSITPKFSNSLILVDFVSSMSNSGANDIIDGYMYMKIGSASASAMPNSSSYHIGYSNYQHARYSPFAFGASYTATSTSTLMFEPYIRAQLGNNSVALIHPDASGSLTVMEIKA